MSARGVHIVTVRKPGKPVRHYIYAWRGGPRIDVVTSPKKPALTRAHLAAIAEAQAADRTLPADEVAGAIARFRKTRYWSQDLSPSTRKTWGWHLDAIEAKWPKVPMRVFSDPRMKPKFVAWRDAIAATSPRTADIGITVLGKFLGWAVLQGLALHNPAAGIPTVYRAQDRAPVIWTDEDIAAIGEHAGQPLRDAVALAALTGLRRADLVALRWDEIGDLAITRTAAKRSRRKRYMVTLPRLPALDALLEDLRARPRKPGVETVLVNLWGQSWTGDGLASSFHDARGKANGGEGIHHVERDPETGEELRIAKRLHDFRGTFATHLITHPTARLTDAEIGRMMGWSETRIAEIRRRYVDDRAIVVALAKRLAGQGTVKRPVKRRGDQALSA